MVDSWDIKEDSNLRGLKERLPMIIEEKGTNSYALTMEEIDIWRKDVSICSNLTLEILYMFRKRIHSLMNSSF